MQLKKSDFSVGQTVYLRILPRSNAWRYIRKEDREIPEKQIKKAKVVSVGKKYITVEVDCHDKVSFDIADNFSQHTSYSIDYTLHLSEEEIIKIIKAEDMQFKIKDHINRKKLDYETAKKICDILALNI